MNIVLLLLSAVVLSLLLTGFLRRYALTHSLLDEPNERSSHQLATPRGGGLAIVATLLLCLPLLVMLNMLPIKTFLALLGGGASVALIGWLDDHGHIAARWRLLTHFVAAGWALYFLGGLPPLPAFGVTIDLHWLGYPLTAIYLVWFLNLFNFMDGIDGIASIEAISVCVGGAILYSLTGDSQGHWLSLLVLATAVTGFLFWNFPPARIFMGDAGSGFLGIILGMFSIQAAWVSPQLFWSWLILLGVFIVDATVTLVRRVWRGEKFYQAHRSHAYQYASRKYDSHLRVTLSVLAINSLWLFPIAYLVAMKFIDGVLGMLLAYIPIIVLAFIFKAGVREGK